MHSTVSASRGEISGNAGYRGTEIQAFAIIDVYCSVTTHMYHAVVKVT